MVERALEAKMSAKEGVMLLLTITETKVKTGPIETAEGQITGAKDPKKVVRQYTNLANA
jgi:hypothetical protein